MLFSTTVQSLIETSCYMYPCLLITWVDWRISIGAKDCFKSMSFSMFSYSFTSIYGCKTTSFSKLHFLMVTAFASQLRRETISWNGVMCECLLLASVHDFKIIPTNANKWDDVKVDVIRPKSHTSGNSCTISCLCLWSMMRMCGRTSTRRYILEIHRIFLWCFHEVLHVCGIMCTCHSHCS